MTDACARHPYEERLSRVLRHIGDNLDGDLSLDALADVACMSRYHWHRVFRAMTGETLADAVRRIRLTKAAHALVRGDDPLADIAVRHGYPNISSFTRAFSAAFHMPPAAFRGAGEDIATTVRMRKGDSTMYPVRIETLAPYRAAGVAHTGPYPDISQAFARLGAILAARNLFQFAAGMVAIYHDAPESKPEADLRSHAAVILGPGFPEGVHGLEYFDLTGGRHAVLEHRGSYATLGAAYEWLYGSWLPQSGEEPSDGPPVELYVNNPQTVATPDLRTDIRLPLK